MDSLVLEGGWLVFVLFFVPGLVSVKIWSLFVPTERMNAADRAFELLAYGAINFALLFWVVAIAVQTVTWAKFLLFFVVLFVFPAVWPVLINGLLRSTLLRGKTLHPVPRAWDAFFGRREPCFVLVHLTNGEMIGGLYSTDSFASSYPSEEDLYIQEVWQINAEGKFLGPITDSSGILVSGSAIDYLEFFRPQSTNAGGTDEHRQEHATDGSSEDGDRETGSS